MALNDEQKKAAAALLAKRPPVHEGTKAIISARQSIRWHSQITDEMNRLRVAQNDSEEFCDLAGVAD